MAQWVKLDVSRWKKTSRIPRPEIEALNARHMQLGFPDIQAGALCIMKPMIADSSYVKGGKDVSATAVAYRKTCLTICTLNAAG
jgi:hypothetical protein